MDEYGIWDTRLNLYIGTGDTLTVDNELALRFKSYSDAKKHAFGVREVVVTIPPSDHKKEWAEVGPLLVDALKRAHEWMNGQHCASWVEPMMLEALAAAEAIKSGGKDE